MTGVHVVRSLDCWTTNVWPSPERSWKPNLPPETIDEVALPFGNSTRQNRVAGLVSTAAVSRPSDRQP